MDLDLMPFEEGQHLVIHDLNCSQGEFIGIEPSPGVPGKAVQNGLEIEFSDTFQSTYEKSIYGHQFPGEIDINMSFPKFRDESFKKLDLVVGECYFSCAGLPFKLQESVEAAGHVISGKNAPNAA